MKMQCTSLFTDKHLDFEGAWARRVAGELGDVAVWILSRRDLLTNKRATGRPQDLADAAALEALE
jgi:hypothetical protein